MESLPPPPLFHTRDTDPEDVIWVRVRRVVLWQQMLVSLVCDPIIREKKLAEIFRPRF